MHYIYDRGEDPEVNHVSDYVTPEKIDAWEPGDNILLIAPTGTGKSHFVKHTLRDYLLRNGLKCLYLVSRVRIKEQFEKELPDDPAICFVTYQTVEELEVSQIASFGKWDVIVSDEAHYFLSDSDFNHRTDVSLDWIMKQGNAIRLFMTATGENIIELFDRCGIPYVGYVLEPTDAKIGNLQFFWNDTRLDTLAEQIISRGDKGIFFIQSARKAYDLYSRFKDHGLFLCSTHNEKYKKYLNEDMISTLLETERFDCSLLITTTALDTGVNIRDQGLTTIVTDVTDPGTIVQCVGRKRFVDKSDRLDLYVRARNSQQIVGMLKKQRERAATIQEFIRRGSVAYNAKNERGNDSARLVFDAPETNSGKTTFSKHLNQLKYAQIQRKIRMYEDMLRRGKYGYIEYIAQILQCDRYSVMEDTLRQENLTEYLDGIAGIPLLTKNDRIPLIETLNIRRNGRLCKTSKVLSAWLESSDLPYRLHEYTTSRTADDGTKKSYRAWEIVKLGQ